MLWIFHLGYCCDKVIVKYYPEWKKTYLKYRQVFGIYTRMPGTLNGFDYYQKKDDHGNYGIWWCKTTYISYKNFVAERWNYYPVKHGEILI